MIKQPVQSSLKLVCERCGILPIAITRSGRTKSVATARFTVYWLAHKLGATHSHISYHLRKGRLGIRKGCLRVEEWRADDPSFRATTDAMLAELSAHDSNHIQASVTAQPASSASGHGIDQQVKAEQRSA